MDSIDHEEGRTYFQKASFISQEEFERDIAREPRR